MPEGFLRACEEVHMRRGEGVTGERKRVNR